MSDFKQEYLSEPMIDHEYEAYVKAWMVYHQTADQIDGHIRRPIGRHQHTVVRRAAGAGRRAQVEFLYMMGIVEPNQKNTEGWKKWHSAKGEALRRLGKL